MKTITIIFMGLIAHVNQPWSLNNTAVIPNAHGHQAEMRVPKAAVLNPQDPWIKQQRIEHDSYVIPLQGLNVRVNKTRGVFAGLSPELIAAMPPLKALAPTCKLKSEVRSRTVTPDLASFIDYRGGRLTPDTYFPKKLGILNTPWSDGRCVVCKIRYEADLHGNEGEMVFIQGDGTKHTMILAGNSVLEVSNEPIPGAAETPDQIAKDAESPDGGHFQNHYSIFQPCNRPTAVPSNKDCDKKEICAVAAASVAHAPFPLADCTNSHYP